MDCYEHSRFNCWCFSLSTFALQCFLTEQSLFTEEKHDAKKSKKEQSSSKSHRKQSDVERHDRHGKDVGVPKNKSNVLEKLTDMLTDDVKYTEDT